MKEIKLTDKFLSKYGDFPDHMNAIGKFVYLRTYSRYIPHKERRETWKETTLRSVQYNVNLLRLQAERTGLKITYKELQKEAEEWFDAMFNLEQLLSGRTMWVGGAEGGVSEKFPSGNFNCSYVSIEKWEDLVEQFYLLLVGTGVGFKHTFKMSEDIAPVRDNFTITHRPYKNMYAQGVRIDKTSTHTVKNKAVIYVGDSKEGWVHALRSFLRIITEQNSVFEKITEIEFSYDYIRESGTKLKTFGGTASGHLPLQEMFTNFEKTIKNQIDPTLAPPERVSENYVRLRPIHVLDFGNFLGNNVQVGGVRRTAEIFLIDGIKDIETVFAKYGLNGFWSEEMFQRHEEIMTEAEKLGLKVPQSAQDVGIRKHGVSVDGFTKQFDTEEEARMEISIRGGHYMFPINTGTGLHHRRMSNNSVAFKEQPPRELLHFIFLMMKAEGEPAFINLRELAMRRFRAIGHFFPTEVELEYAMEKLGMNPCAEILLWTKAVCNLTTINVPHFVKNGKLDVKALMKAQKRSARAGLRMTLVDLEVSEEWKERQHKDRLLGLSLTGWQDAMSLIGYTMEQQEELLEELRDVGRGEANRYADYIGVNRPLLTTTVKPEGTGSQVLGGVSSGLHYAHSEYFIRRIRLSANDPLAQAVQEHKGWIVNAEVGTEGETHEERMKNARTLVIDFPVYSGAKATKENSTVDMQFDTYFMFQKHYSEHNSSNTIDIKSNEEWERAEERIWEGYDDFVGVSFLASDGGTYKLAPYEAIDKATYESMKDAMEDFDMEKLAKFEVGATDDFDIGNDGCETGACPTR